MTTLDNATLNAMTEQQLLELNKTIVEAIRFKRRTGASLKLAEFQIGQKVEFLDKLGAKRVMTVTRVNQKTLSGVETNAAGHEAKWRVHVNLAKPYVNADAPAVVDSSVGSW